MVSFSEYPGEVLCVFQTNHGAGRFIFKIQIHVVSLNIFIYWYASTSTVSHLIERIRFFKCLERP